MCLLKKSVMQLKKYQRTRIVIAFVFNRPTAFAPCGVIASLSRPAAVTLAGSVAVIAVGGAGRPGECLRSLTTVAEDIGGAASLQDARTAAALCGEESHVTSSS